MEELEVVKVMLNEALNCNITDISAEYQNDGLTNRNYIITKDGIKYAIRVGGENSNNLGINRFAELVIMKAVAEIGVGAELIYFSTDTGNMITKYIEGKKWSSEDVSTPENIRRIAVTLKKVHNLPPVQYNFSPYKDIEDRLQFANHHNLELPDYLGKLLDKLNLIKQDREKNKQLYLGLCHNDPFPNNFLDDGTVRLIDWEYGGMGDIFFDLASACMFYSQVQKEEFLKHYFGQCDKVKMQSLDQMSFVVSFWNSMWAVLQTKLSNSEHDYKVMAQQMFSHMKGML